MYIFINKSVLSILKYRVACLNMKWVLRVEILFICQKFHHSGETICPVFNYIAYNRKLLFYLVLQHFDIVFG